MDKWSQSRNLSGVLSYGRTIIGLKEIVNKQVRVEMTYKIYLREGNDLRFIAETDAEMWPIPNPGERWQLQIDGKEWRCEIVELGHPRLGPDGRTLLSQDIFVQRIGIPN